MWGQGGMLKRDDLRTGVGVYLFRLEDVHGTLSLYAIKVIHYNNFILHRFSGGIIIYFLKKEQPLVYDVAPCTLYGQQLSL